MSDPKEKATVQLGYHFVDTHDLNAMVEALEDIYCVKRIRMPANIGLRGFSAAFIEIALGVLAGGVGAAALKKVIELVTEDLYKCAKKFTKAYIKHRKKNEFGSITTQLQISFELQGVSFCGIVNSSDEREVASSLEHVGNLLQIAERLLGRLQTSEIESVKFLEAEVTLQNLDSVIFVFDPTSDGWEVAELGIRDGASYRAVDKHVHRWGIPDAWSHIAEPGDGH